MISRPFNDFLGTVAAVVVCAVVIHGVVGGGESLCVVGTVFG